MMKKLETLRRKENPNPHKLESLKAKCETMQEQDQADYESRISLASKWFRLISKCTPKRTAHRTDLSPWIKPSTSHMMKKLETLRRKENPNPHKLESLKAKCETMQEQDQADYESRLFQGRETSRIFKSFKSLRRSKLSPILTWNERQTSKEGRAELLCEYFASITETNHDYSVIEDPHTHGDLSLIISADEISNELSVLDPSKSRGEDKLPASVMKETANKLKTSLFNIFKNIKRLTQVPARRKHGIIIPIYKGGKISDVGNYRPVTLLNTPIKVFERIIYKRLMEVITHHCSSAQYGFMKRRSTILQLLKSITMIYDAAAEEFLLLLFDFSKAFDKINHGIMVKKLSLLGLDRNFYYIIKSYLTGRTQSVRIEDHLSAPRIVQTGVPQGSVLGPLFFLLYINDLPSIIYSSTALMFADDLKLFFRGTTNSLDQLQQDLINLELWSTQNHLLFNAKKCNMLVFNFQIPPSLKFMGNVLSDINCVKDWN